MSLSEVLFFIIEHSVLVVSLFFFTKVCYKGNDAKDSAILSFFLLPKEPSKCSACVVSQKMRLNAELKIGNTLICREPLNRISRKLARKYLKKQVTEVLKKIGL